MFKDYIKKTYLYKLLCVFKKYSEYYISLFYIKKTKRKVYINYKKSNIINVIFIVQYLPSWQNLKPIYDRMLKDSRYNPTIVCVPFRYINEKDALINNDVYKYFKQKGYKNVINSIENGEYFDIKKLNPSYVFHTRPYNNLRPKCYSSKKIRKFSLICSIAYAARLTETIVGINDDYYMDTYCYFAFDQEEIDYYKNRYYFGINKQLQHCLPYGQTCLEKIFNCNVAKKNRKTVLWTPRWSMDSVIGGSNFLNYKDTLFELANKHRDIDFIFRPHPLLFNNFIVNGLMTQKEVDEFKNRCHRENNIILNDESEYTNLLCNSDLLITDFSSIFVEYYVTKKPIIYCKPEINIKYTKVMKKMLSTTVQVNNKDELCVKFEQVINKHTQPDKDIIIEEYFSNAKESSNMIVDVLPKLIN